MSDKCGCHITAVKPVQHQPAQYQLAQLSQSPVQLPQVQHTSSTCVPLSYLRPEAAVRGRKQALAEQKPAGVRVQQLSRWLPRSGPLLGAPACSLWDLQPPQHQQLRCRCSSDSPPAHDQQGCGAFAAAAAVTKQQLARSRSTAASSAAARTAGRTTEAAIKTWLQSTSFAIPLQESPLCASGVQG